MQSAEEQVDTRQLVAEWLVRYRREMLSVARSFRGAAHDAEDIVQEAAVVVLKRHREAAGVTRPGGWIRIITRTTGLQIARKRGRRAALRRARGLYGAGVGYSDGDEVETWLRGRAEMESRDFVLEMARHLPSALGELVHCMLVDGMSDDEIARRLGISRTAVRIRRSRAVRAIRGGGRPENEPMLVSDSTGRSRFRPFSVR